MMINIWDLQEIIILSKWLQFNIWGLLEKNLECMIDIWLIHGLSWLIASVIMEEIFRVKLTRLFIHNKNKKKEKVELKMSDSEGQTSTPGNPMKYESDNQVEAEESRKSPSPSTSKVRFSNSILFSIYLSIKEIIKSLYII